MNILKNFLDEPNDDMRMRTTIPPNNNHTSSEVELQGGLVFPIKTIKLQNLIKKNENEHVRVKTLKLNKISGIGSEVFLVKYEKKIFSFNRRILVPDLPIRDIIFHDNMSWKILYELGEGTLLVFYDSVFGHWALETFFENARIPILFGKHKITEKEFQIHLNFSYEDNKLREEVNWDRLLSLYPMAKKLKKENPNVKIYEAINFLQELIWIIMDKRHLNKLYRAIIDLLL